MILLITLGGIAGTLARYFLQGLVQPKGDVFPWGTLAVNISGSLLLGLIMRLATGAAIISPQMRVGLTIGFCGAFTTMSTFSYETIALTADGEYWRAGLYAGSTVIGCLAATAFGMALASKLL
ncbi:MAG TPA: fluoride efflux transporter CrcB [Gemmatimonadales bacterium]|nr:fluoride efflux transporter CrcB [Gemmatimonadales bacterium]